MIKNFLTTLMILPLAFLASCGNNNELMNFRDDVTSTLSQDTLVERAKDVGAHTGTYESDDKPASCPLLSAAPATEPKKDTDEDELESRPVEPNREINDLATTFIVQQFFTTKDTLFNFMQLVYGNLDRTLDTYRKDVGLEEKAITPLAKGGNVLRMIANKAFSMVTPEARDLLKAEYSQFFKRSDADFSVYIDESRLGDLDYERTFAEVNELVFQELKKIRQEFQGNPEKYFNIFQLKSSLASEKLKIALANLGKTKAVADPSNPNWYGAKFHQLLLVNEKAMEEPACGYRGQSDFRMIPKEGSFQRISIPGKPNWIQNTDNRAIEAPWETDPSKLVKFALSRSKVAFEALLEKDNASLRKAVVGELVDVSIPHRRDTGLQHFMAHFDDNLAQYNLRSDDGQTLPFKAYSLGHLADDLKLILFETSARPWADNKYEKRVYRLLLLAIIELLGNYGVGGSQIVEFIDDVKNKIMTPLASLLPRSESSPNVVAQAKAGLNEINGKWTSLPIFQSTLEKIVELVGKLADSPNDDDEAKFKEFVEIVNKNFDNAARLGRMNPLNFNISEIYNVDMDHLF